MRALCVTLHDPFRPAVREVRWLRRPARIRSLAPRTGRPHVAVLNGRPVLRAGWRRKLRGGDVLAFVVLPRGGQGGSNPLRTLLLIAVLAFSIVGPGLILGAAANSVLFGSFTLGQAVGLGISLVGSILVNALLPPPGASASSLPTPSPTYSLQAQGNLARLDQAIPVQYGRLRVFPDLASQPWVDYSGGEQYLHQLLCVGHGEYDVEEIRIEDTPVSAFLEIETELVAPGGQVTLIPQAVTTSGEVSGQKLAGPKTGTYAQSGTTVTVTETAHGRAVGQGVYLDFTSGTAVDGAFAIATVPTVNTFTVTAAGSLTTSGNVSIQSIVGGEPGFVANAAGTATNRLGIDIVLPRGLYHAEVDGTLTAQQAVIACEARPIDDAGLPTGAWTTLGTETIRARTTTPVRRSFRYVVAAGRWQVRARRTDTEQTAAEYGHEALWAGLRAYLRATRTYGDVTLLAMRMRASNNLSAQAARRVNVICTRKLSVWNGSTWSAATATRSIAWALADAARSTSYGAGMADAEIDLAGLLALDAVWAARGDELNGRFDSAVSWWEAITRMARAGRARAFLQGGILRVVRDGPAGVPTALFSMRNIVRNSFGIDYVLSTDDSADAVEVSYFDAAVWTQRRVTATLAGGTQAKPARIDLWGVTDRDHALREGLYQAASNRYRRRLVRFATEMEGFIPSPGDAIAIQHDMPGWGQHAEAVAWNPATLTLTLSEPPVWGAGSHSIGLRTREGGLDGPIAVTPGATAHEVVLAAAPAATPYLGRDEERTHVVCGAGEAWRALARVLAVRPRGLREVQIDAVIEDPSVHTADTGQVAPPIVVSELPARYVAPAVTGVVMRQKPDEVARILMSWSPAPGADVYQVEMAEGDDALDPDLDWTRVADTTASHLIFRALYLARTLIRVRGVGLAAGPWVVVQVGSVVPFMWSADATPMWTADGNLMWS